MDMRSSRLRVLSSAGKDEISVYDYPNEPESQIPSENLRFMSACLIRSYLSKSLVLGGAQSDRLAEEVFNPMLS
jgi:hypothetical protein